MQILFRRYRGKWISRSRVNNNRRTKMGKVYDKMVEHVWLSTAGITVVAAGGGLLLGYILKTYAPELIDPISIGLMGVGILIFVGVLISITRDKKVTKPIAPPF